MPDVTVEMAFDSGFKTPAASRTWTDVSDYVELDRGFTVTWGRSDERSTADANQLTGLVLDNSDGRFTSGLASGPYHPLLVNTPVRVLVDPVDGSEVDYFMGFVSAWPTEWSEGTDATAYATIGASSRLAKMGTQASLKSIVESTILADAPAAYYTLGEPAAATQANDSSGNSVAPLVLAGDLTLPLVFGSATGPGTDSMTAAQFAGGQYLLGGSVATPTAMSIECFVLAETVPTSTMAVVYTESGSFGLGINTLGELYAYQSGGATVETPGSICDGATHHVAATLSATTLTLYLDGVSIGTAGATPTFATGTISVGGVGHLPSVADTPVIPLTGVAAHVAAYTSALSSTRITAHAAAGLTGFAGETTDARLIRYAELAGLDAADVDAETGSTTMQHVDTTDKQVVELMRTCETTEGGLLFDERDGTLTFHNRAHRYTSSAIYTLDMAQQEVEANYSPRVDLTGLANDISAQDTSGVYTAHVFDDDSRDAYGDATASIETASEDDDEPRNLASWNLYEFKDPKERAPNLEVDVLAQVGKTPNSSAVLATTVGDKITVSNRPSQASSSTVDYFIEGGTAVFGPESLKLTLNVSPSAPYDEVLIIDDATRGVIDTNVIGL